MSWMLLLLTLTGGSPAAAHEPVRCESLTEAAAQIRPELQTGSLIATEGDCLAVRVFTRSPYTHVAAVVMRNGQPFVYDSANGTGVRCQTLENYLASQSPDELHLFHPARAFDSPTGTQLEKWLDSQLGRPYSVAHHLTGSRCEGLHCAEYVTDALIQCGLITAKQPARVSPATLIHGVAQSRIYATGRTLRIMPAQPPQQKSSGWCDQLWQDTKLCTADCWKQTRAWFLCR